MNRKGGEWFYIKFQYERLPSFCFYCGIIGHSEQACEMEYDDLNASSKPLPYGPGLRASSRRNTVVDGSRWIHQDGGLTPMAVGNSSGDSMQVDHISQFGKVYGTANNLGISGVIVPSLNFRVNEGPYGKLDSTLDGGLIDIPDSQDGAIIIYTKRKRIEAIEGAINSGSEAVKPLPISDKNLPKTC